MSLYTFEMIKQNVLEWSKFNIQNYLNQKVCIEVTKNEADILLIDLTFQYCLARIEILNPSFAPYQYVSFEAMTLDSLKAQNTGKPEMVYFFYDSVGMQTHMVLEELSFGVKISSEYLPDQLSKKYLNKNGKLTINSNMLYHIMHPDDVKYYDKELHDNVYTYIDTEAQYLILKSKFKLIRVLPDVFTVILNKHILFYMWYSVR